MVKNVELLAITKLNDGSELVQTGIWVRSNITLDGIFELFENGVHGRPVDKIEFSLKGEDD